MSYADTRQNMLHVVEQLKTDTITNTEAIDVDHMFSQNTRGKAHTDGVISVGVYLDVQTGTLGTTVITATPLDRHGNEFDNASDYAITLYSGTPSSATKGTDGGLWFEITGFPKCFGLRINIDHTGTVTANVTVSFLF